MTGNFSQSVHSKRGLTASKKREWEAVGSAKSASAFRKVLTGAVPVFAVAFCTAFMASSIFTPIESSDAVNKVTANITSDGYYVKINSSDVEFNLVSTPSGAMTAVNSVVKTATNAPSGYKLYLGMSDQDSEGNPKSAADALKNGLYLDEDLSSGDVLAAVSGTAVAPAALSNNTWGYAVDKNTEGAPTTWTTLDHTTIESATPNNELYAAVPGFGSEDLVQTVSTPTTSKTEANWTDSDWEDGSGQFETASMYYGARANMAMTSGAYSNTIAYTAIAQISPSTGGLSFSPGTYARNDRYESATWNDTLTIKTPLLTATNMELGDNIAVTLSGGPDSSNRTFSCPVTSASVVPVSGTTSGYATIQCTLPQAYAGEYTVIVDIPKFGVQYTGTYTYTVTWSTISLMQEMTPAVCTSAGVVTTSTATVPEVYLKDIRGGGGHISGTKGNYSYTGWASWSDTGTEPTTGQYRIRKLADGNCWMTENLDLEMATSTTFHDYDTNLASNTTWTPSTNTIHAPIAAIEANAETRVVDRSYRGNSSQSSSATPQANTRSITDLDGVTQSIGTYYDWAAAVADRTDYTTDYTTAGTNINTSICPKGWTLPKGDASASKSFQNLATTYGIGNDAAGSTAMRTYPLSFVFSGRYYWVDGTLANHGANGIWWSSTVNSETNSRLLIINASNVYPQYYNNKLFGLSVRCVSL